MCKSNSPTHPPPRLAQQILVLILIRKILRNKNILSSILNTYLVHSSASGYEDALTVLGRLIFVLFFKIYIVRFLSKSKYSHLKENLLLLT